MEQVAYRQFTRPSPPPEKAWLREAIHGGERMSPDVEAAQILVSDRSTEVKCSAYFASMH